MAIAPMEKILIVAHRSQAAELLEALQEAGLVHLLDAAQAMVSKEWPELQTEFRRPRELEELLGRLERAVEFLESFAPEPSKGGLFSSRLPVESSQYLSIISGQEAMALLKETERLADRLEELRSEQEQTSEQLHRLLPWRTLTCRLEDLMAFSTVEVYAGMIPVQHAASAQTALEEMSCLVETVGQAENRKACLIFALAAQTTEVQKILRGAEFEAVHLEGLKGTPAELIEQCRRRLQEIDETIGQVRRQAADLSQRRVELKVLADYYRNLLERKTAQAQAAATEQTLFLEGWTKQKDYPRVQEIVRRFSACDVTVLIPMEGEEPPVEIENAGLVRPFETITRLYGVPSPRDVDPTMFLAPFFAVFFGLCLTDAGYGIVLTALLVWVLRKLQGDKRAIQMLLICSILTIAAGAVTGGWFADTIQTLLPQEEGSLGARLNLWREKLMLFDPMQHPLIFIGLALGLGYVQVLFGLAVAFVNLLQRRRYAEAVFEKLTWIVLLNCLLILGLASQEKVPAFLAAPAGWLALATAAVIFWFTERKSGLAGRIGGGTFAVFSTVFYLGDILSYVRLMALGMVTGGLGMAINILTKLLMDIPYVGFILGLVLFVAGHGVNIVLSLLSAFVHSLRLQFVEFFPKFFSGGGREFSPLRTQYKHVLVVENQTRKS